jgi:hypothetical protein
VERILKLPALAMIPVLKMPKDGNNHLRAPVPQPSDAVISGTAS